MPDSNEVAIPRRVVTSRELDPSTRWLGWAVAAALLMLIAVVAYAVLAGDFGSTAPRTAEEDALATTAAAIAKDPTDGKQYAIRAEALFKLGRKSEAYQTLDTGEAAVKDKNPALLYVMRSRTALLNEEGRYKEAVTSGLQAMKQSDDYLGEQGAKLAAKGVTGISGNMKTAASVDTALQLAQAYMGVRQPKKALKMYTYALSLEPTGGDILALRGWAYLRSGDKDKARQDFEAALKYLPDDPTARSGMKALSDQ